MRVDILAHGRIGDFAFRRFRRRNEFQHNMVIVGFIDQRSIRRLVHGVFDGGVIENIDFALEGSP